MRGSSFGTWIWSRFSECVKPPSFEILSCKTGSYNTQGGSLNGQEIRFSAIKMPWLAKMGDVAYWPENIH